MPGIHRCLASSAGDEERKNNGSRSTTKRGDSDSCESPEKRASDLQEILYMYIYYRLPILRIKCQSKRRAFERTIDLFSSCMSNINNP